MSCTVWTDMKWVPEARDFAQRQGWTVVAGSASESGPMESVDAVVAGALLAGDAAFFARAPRLRVWARSGAGYDRVDLAAATAAGVVVVHTPEAPTTSTAEFALLLMLAVRRRLVAGVQRLSTGGWSGDPALTGEDLAGRTLGLVGLGRIGSRVAELARGFRMEVQAFDPARTSWPVEVRRVEDIDVLCATSDIISLHAPSLPATHHLFDAARLARCKPGAVLINTARGSLVDEAALAAALRSGALSGAGIDVWEPEPPAADHPLRKLPNVVATPHMAAMTRDGRRRSQLAALTQVAEVLGGRRPAHLLNPAVWTRRRGQEQAGAS